METPIDGGSEYLSGASSEGSIDPTGKYLGFYIKVEIFLEQREVVFFSPSKICENLNFSREIQIFAHFGR